MFAKILVANRGEIACRVMRTARRMGIRTAAVYSDADARARHVALADEAFRIGPPEAKQSYLRADRIVEAARRCGAAAIHPGYGFLSENVDFAEACTRAGIAFIGPPPAAIRAMGNKSAAKALMEKAGVAIVPGYHGDDRDPDFLLAQAARIGFPVLIKAAAGGGGKGMRAVGRESDFATALAACRREAASAFGDERVLLEKYIERPRHIEIQIFADNHGNCVSLFERDCSVQRRHQKVLEEAPAPGIDAERREEMSAAAIAAATAAGYVGAGTVEFLVDRGGAFYFMEMNARLQVEHPVTEMIAGLDLVEWQLRVAAGEELPLAQHQLRLEGHAFEARVYAEDPENDFLPAAGRLVHLAAPAESEHVRVDTGVRAGDEITPYYDPLIAKLVVWDRDRALALTRLRAALIDFEVAGLATNLAFLQRLAEDRDLAAAAHDTGLIERHRGELLARPVTNERVLALAAVAALFEFERRARPRQSGERSSPWQPADGWRLNEPQGVALVLDDGERRHALGVWRLRDGFRLDLGDGRRVHLANCQRKGVRLNFQLDEMPVAGKVIAHGKVFEVLLPGERHRLELHDPLAQELESDAPGAGLTAPLPGKIVSVLVEPGASVEKGASLLILEAMKMEHTIRAPARGRVARVCHGVGTQVVEGAELIEFEAEA